MFYFSPCTFSTFHCKNEEGGESSTSPKEQWGKQHHSKERKDTPHLPAAPLPKKGNSARCGEKDAAVKKERTDEQAKALVGGSSDEGVFFFWTNMLDRVFFEQQIGLIVLWVLEFRSLHCLISTVAVRAHGVSRLTFSACFLDTWFTWRPIW